MSRPVRHVHENVGPGIIVIVVTGFTMAFGDAVVKYISSDFELPQIFVLRSLVAIPVLLGLLLFSHRPGTSCRDRSGGPAAQRAARADVGLLLRGPANPEPAWWRGPTTRGRCSLLLSALLIGERCGPEAMGGGSRRLHWRRRDPQAGNAGILLCHAAPDRLGAILCAGCDRHPRPLRRGRPLVLSSGPQSFAAGGLARWRRRPPRLGTDRIAKRRLSVSSRSLGDDGGS